METIDFRKVLYEQHDELNREIGKKLVPRQEESQIDLDSELAQVVIGVRRSGKSTLCRKVLAAAGCSYGYVNFDDERLSKLSRLDLDKLLEACYLEYGRFTHLFLDEIQNVDGWPLFVNRLLRSGLHLLLTGSNSKLLSTELSTFLTGRYNKITLFPYSFSEYCHAQDVDLFDLSTAGHAMLTKSFEAYLLCGGMPEMQKKKKTQPSHNFLNGMISERS